MRRLMAVAVLLVAVGCGGGEDAGPPTVAGLAERLRKAGIPCDGLEWNREVLIAREEGSCDSGDERLTIDTFNDNDSRTAAEALAKSFGLILVRGDRWLVSATTDDGARRVRVALGGTLA
ncbi:MAG: hypothetical protein LC798_02955 [Chloroflexi bacterium]|nr:hypothetical protein [Chloroflexota bacterium]